MAKMQRKLLPFCGHPRMVSNDIERCMWTGTYGVYLTTYVYPFDDGEYIIMNVLMVIFTLKNQTNRRIAERKIWRRRVYIWLFIIWLSECKRWTDCGVVQQA